uniref:Uncharacterized protein n=1 Tax=Oryza nivara TaxID=4536 RepID=A0A0E0HPV5_ORYNI
MNSMLEAVFAGVPMLTLPLDSTDKDRLIRREEIARAVKRLMASEEAEMKAIRRPLLSGKRFLIEQSTRVYLRIVIWLH